MLKLICFNGENMNGEQRGKYFMLLALTPVTHFSLPLIYTQQRPASYFTSSIL